MTLSFNHCNRKDVELKRLLRGSRNTKRKSNPDCSKPKSPQKNPQSGYLQGFIELIFPTNVLFCPTPPLQHQRSRTRSSCYIREAATYEEMGTKVEYFLLSSNSQL